MKSHQGLVALLDVLGFSDLMTRQSPEESGTLGVYVEAVERGCKGTEALMFSDTILLTRALGSDPDADLLAIFRACASLMGWLLIANVPVRGAIAFGSYYRVPQGDSVFAAGGPIVEAHRREESQEWLGITLCPSVVRRFPDLERRAELSVGVADEERIRALHSRLPLCRYLQPWDLIPLKDGRGGIEMYDGLAVVPILADEPPPTKGDRKRLPQLALVQRCIRKLRSEAPDARAQAKYQRTSEFLSSVQGKLTAAKELFERFNLPLDGLELERG
jgi:hypothetical protein